MSTYNIVVAKWWADQIRANRKELNRKKPKKCDINSFESLLATRIQEAVEKDSTMTLYCDYTPLGVLCDVAIQCHLNSVLDLFPEKSSMNISKSVVSVKAGYGEPFETIFKAN